MNPTDLLISPAYSWYPGNIFGATPAAGAGLAAARAPAPGGWAIAIPIAVVIVFTLLWVMQIWRGRR